MNSNNKPRVCIVYSADPLGDIPGGIDSYIRGVIRSAPPDLSIRVVGVTTDRAARPLRQWTTCRIGDAQFAFFPLIFVRHSEKQARIPVTLRFLAALQRNRAALEADILEFHRIEPSLAFRSDPRPKTLVMHQNMNVLHSRDSDIRWKYWPGLYFALERRLIPGFSTITCVREDAARDYQERFPGMKDRIRFTPTWLDTEVFRPPTDEQRRAGRQALNEEFGFDDPAFVLVTVGRQDRQKSPLLLIDAFRELHHALPGARLLLIGDGVLRGQIESRVRQYELQAMVKLCGVKRPAHVARYLQAADVFVLSSAYEGMPISVLEALGSGLPVVSTDVGEVKRVVRPGVNGELVTEHDATSLARAILRCHDNIERYRGKPCTDAVREYTPGIVLQPIYQNYRQLADEAVQ